MNAHVYCPSTKLDHCLVCGLTRADDIHRDPNELGGVDEAHSIRKADKQKPS